MKDVTNEIAKQDTNLVVNYQPDSPELQNYNELKAQIEFVHNRYSNLIVKDAAEAQELSKRGGLLTKLRKISGSLTDRQRDVHRAAKDSYKEFDNKINDLKFLVDDSIDKIKRQVDDFHEKEQIRMINNSHEVFDEVINSDQFKEKLPSWYTWQEYFKFNNQIFKEKPEKQKVEIIQTLSNVYHDLKEITNEYHKNESTWFLKAAMQAYQDSMDLDHSMSEGFKKDAEAKEIIRIEREKMEQKIKKDEEYNNYLKRQEQIKKTNKDVIYDDDTKNMYVFGIMDQEEAMKIKDILDSDGMKYAFKVIKK